MCVLCNFSSDQRPFGRKMQLIKNRKFAIKANYEKHIIKFIWNIFSTIQERIKK